MKSFLYLIICFKLFPACSEAQVSSLGFSVKKISEYIASEAFSNVSLKLNDLALLDSLYLKVLEYMDHDYSETLHALTFSCIPYKEIPIRIPVVKIRINIPLVAASDSIFRLKNKNLPSELFYDSPQSELGDKDKLAHFFGSAFLSYNTRLFDITEIIGIFIEDFEQSFYIQASADPRDILADNLGNIFGKILKKNKDILPSQVLITKPLKYFRYSL